MVTITINLPDDLDSKLESLAKATGQTKESIIVQAIKKFVDRELCKIAEIKKCKIEANAGHSATDEEKNKLNEKK